MWFRQSGNFILELELLALQATDGIGVGHGAGYFGLKLPVKMAMPRPEGLDSVFERHRKAPLPVLKPYYSFITISLHLMAAAGEINSIRYRKNG